MMLIKIGLHFWGYLKKHVNLVVYSTSTFTNKMYDLLLIKCNGNRAERHQGGNFRKRALALFEIIACAFAQNNFIK